MTNPDDIDREIRREYEADRIYSAQRICADVKQTPQNFADRLLAEKIAMVRRHTRPGLTVDLGCATGGHLFALADHARRGIGIDFSSLFVAEAERQRAECGLSHLSFVCADARRLPLPDRTVDALYSFSTLYAIPRVCEVIAEIARVLRPGGRCVLDFGNNRSLNRLVTKWGYRELPPTFPIPVAKMLHLCARSGLKVIEHRSFQLLPLWADRPRWLAPLLHPYWARALARPIRGRMLDERISSLPGLRRLAFRHLVVCERIG